MTGVVTVTTPVRVAGGTIHVLPTVHGLAAEADRVREAYARVAPRAVALGVSEENVAGLRYYLKEGTYPSTEDEEDRDAGPAGPEGAAAPARAPGDPPRRHADGTLYEEDVEDEYEYDAEALLTNAELSYGLALRKFGEVRLPPLDLLAAVELADADAVPVEAVDFTEDEYGDVFAANVSTWALFRFTRRTRRLEKRPPRAEDAQAFAIAWDRYLRGVKGIDAVERAREQRMAERAKAVAREHGTVLLILEATREAGVLEALRAPD